MAPRVNLRRAWNWPLAGPIVSDLRLLNLADENAILAREVCQGVKDGVTSIVRTRC
jgi:hypothetical protein